MFSFFRIARDENTEIRGSLIGFAREIGADDLPTVSRIGRFEQYVGREVERVRFERRKNNRQRARIAIFAAANGLRGNFRVLADILLCAREPVAIQNVRIERVDGDVAVLENSRQLPIAKRNFAVIAAALRRNGAAFLLRAVNPIRKTIVGGDVIELGGWLIVPTAPGRAAVHADDRALVGAERDDLRIFRADPDALVIVAARRAFEPHECFSAVRGLPRRSVRDINHVRIVRRDGDAHRARAAAADAVVGVCLFPGFSRIVRAIHSPDLGSFCRNIDSLCIARRNRNADSPKPFARSRQSLVQRLPSIPAVRRFIEPASRDVDRSAAPYFPWRDACGPQHRVDCFRIRGIESKVSGAGVLVLVENFLESLSAVGGTKDPALGVRAVRMSFGGNENAVGIFRVDENCSDLLGVTEVLQMRPRFSGVGGFVDAIAGREIRALQSFAAAHVNDIRVGRSNGKRADGTAGLIVENRIPGVAEIGGLPDAAVDRGHVEDIRLMRHAGDGHGAAPAERADATPAHFRKEFLIKLLADLLVELLRVRRSAKISCENSSSDAPLPCHTDSHPSPPREGRGYSGCGNGAMWGRRRRGRLNFLQRSPLGNMCWQRPSFGECGGTSRSLM